MSETALIIIVVTLCLTFVVWACRPRCRGCEPPRCSNPPKPDTPLIEGRNGPAPFPKPTPPPPPPPKQPEAKP